MRCKAVVLAASLAALPVVAGCSNSSCKTGTLLLHLALLDDAPLADTITVVGNDPGAAVSQSFPHTPNPDAAALRIERTAVVVTWPGGYPVHAIVGLTVTALSGATVVGSDISSVRLDDKCTETSVLVSNRYHEAGDGGAGQ